MFYLDLFKCLARHRVRYLLVGGLAMNLHGVPRMTLDVDIVLLLDQENLECFFAACRELGLKPTLPIKMEELIDPNVRREWAESRNMIALSMAPEDLKGPTIDILIEPPIDIEAAMERAEYRTVGDVSVPIASIEDMMRLKENTGRAQDQSDIEHLHRIKRRNHGGETSNGTE